MALTGLPESVVKPFMFRNLSLSSMGDTSTITMRRARFGRSEPKMDKANQSHLMRFQ
jgi:hypothetical protein